MVKIYVGDCRDVLRLDTTTKKEYNDVVQAAQGRFVLSPSEHTIEDCGQSAPYKVRPVCLDSDGTESCKGRFVMDRSSDRNEKGQFIAGIRSSPETEFKKGCHWREPKPYWDRDWLYTEYVINQRSAADIAIDFDCNENNIMYFLKKHKIETRTMSETRAVKHWGLSGEQNAMYGKRGTEVPSWKGGCTPERQAFYSSRSEERRVGKEC